MINNLTKSGCMLYALGAIDYGAKNNKDGRAVIDLGEVLDDWKGYSITKRIMSADRNAYYMIYCSETKFGSEDGFCNLAEFRQGYSLQHLIALIISVLDMHKSENKNKNKKKT